MVVLGAEVELVEVGVPGDVGDTGDTGDVAVGIKVVDDGDAVAEARVSERGATAGGMTTVEVTAMSR